MNAKGAILAIDPGPKESAWVVLDPSGAVAAHAKEPNEALRNRLLGLAKEFGGVRMFNVFARGSTFEWSPIESVAIEMIASYGMAVGAEVFETCTWIGRYVELCCDMPTRLVYRSEVKSHLCRSQKANDSNIRTAIIDRYGPGKDVAIGKKKSPGPLFGLSGDGWSALAVAITARETETSQEKAA